MQVSISINLLPLNSLNISDLLDGSVCHKKCGRWSGVFYSSNKSETDQIFSFLHTFIHHHRHQTALIMCHLTKLCGALQYNKNTKAIDLARIKHT